ncbi:hypothetical protein VPNG_09333 [Cytospora leucostoma]|uniref:Uncharacterized protein n=1 Tax=Cytospora leucostoma TaxID=1230097 RepID=A0A423VT18_9PEZI|nr:hypothetical protein VPNG_09333 [Cytospora leucostoma]
MRAPFRRISPDNTLGFLTYLLAIVGNLQHSEEGTRDPIVFYRLIAMEVMKPCSLVDRLRQLALARYLAGRPRGSL